MSEETILLIDIDQLTEQKIVSSLEAEGYLVFTASGKDAAVQIAQRVSPTLICIDPSATGGLGTCKELHDNPPLKKVPILVITSYGGEMEPRFTALYGITDFLKAPFTENDLLSKVRQCIEAVVPGQKAPEEETAISAEKEEMSFTEQPEEAEKQSADIDKHAELFEEDTAAAANAPTSWKTERLARPGGYRKHRAARKSGGRNRMPFYVLILIIITAAGLGTGLYAYRFFMQAPEDAGPANVRPREAKPDITKTPQQQPLPQDVKSPVTLPAVQVPVPDKASEQTSSGKRDLKVVYSVQAGAFKSHQNAEALAKKLKESGFEAFVQEGLSKDREVVFRVLIGRYSERRDAAAAAARIKDKAGTSVTIFSE